MFNVNDYIVGSKIYGPFSRLVVWFQGCSVRCKGCINSDMWDFNCEKHIMSSQDITNLIINNNCEGITLLGGEPLDQKNILELIKKLKENDLGIVLFTGYEWNTNDNKKQNIMKQCDLVVAGPFDISKRNEKLYLRGSINQQLIYNTKRYFNFCYKERKQIEVEIEESNVNVRGIVNNETLLNILHGNN